MPQFLLLLNSLASFASVAGAMISIAKPEALSGSLQVTNGERFYQRMYAVRAVPLEALAAILPFYLGGPAVASVVGVSAFVQAADVMIGVSKKDAGMILGASFATAIHVLCFLSIS
ncbi:hypothetical protein N7447_002024 [Penicillium robsamsonii]|uniref:uncharacterized protein n=1 Tax=Penicillium robsamsonii TaxID=1792511 RepID=UPI0025486EBA|nr:uncharacterized protein N7447_002024 [Penicillium robsamsonii]KAJ5835998.1 hypothetical protein N7447_002024 [Penicillium robsamsonii]